MKTIIFIAELCGLLLICSGSNAYPSYNEEINRAELDIVSNNFVEANKHFKNAFDINNHPQPIDAENAVINAVIINDFDQAFAFAKKIAETGVGRTYFEKLKRFSILKSKKEWALLLTYASEQKLRIDTEGHKLIIELIDLQKKYQKIISLGFNKNTSKENLGKLTDEKLAIEQTLHNLFVKEGYLSEYQIGANIKNDTLFSYPIFSDIIIYSYMPDLSKKEFVYKEPDQAFYLFMDEMKKGTISFYYLQDIITNQQVMNLRLPSIGQFGCSFYACKKSELSPFEIDNRRRKIGLCSYDDYMKKFTFVIENPNSPFTIFPKNTGLSQDDGLTGQLSLPNVCSLVYKIPNCK
ncbi:hypothetical protein [Pedobacter sp. GR22-10]|uniref:hypothetical protein n=1 Tax=Pedobacter sp. GR22-10 TaxID=2994472 RepID=UPI0022486644|nr:hypothetical protein [Pedobacter sp. GR22-10]MCX2429852.1 hypothetical protein [Pedobacter sp. GR22-10]